MMTERQIQQVRTSFRQIEPVATGVAALFYIRLSELDPSVKRPVTPYSPHADEVACLLPILVECVERPGRIPEIVESLGPRGRKRVRSMHYPAAVKALLWALEKAIGGTFDAEHRRAWAAAYESLAATIETGVGPSDATPPAGVCFA